MSSPVETPFGVQFERSWVPNSGKGILSDYLDEFCLPLYEVMSVREVQEYRLLVAAHLDEIVAEFQANAWGMHGAVHAALREHGDAHRMGTLLRDEFLRSKRSSLSSDTLLKPSKRLMVGWLVAYLIAAFFLGMLPDSVLVPFVFLASSLAAGCVVGIAAARCPFRPGLWGGIAAIYPLVLTTLLVILRDGLNEVGVCMALWVVVLVVTAVRVWWSWRVRRQREIYRRFLA